MNKTEKAPKNLKIPKQLTLDNLPNVPIKKSNKATTPIKEKQIIITEVSTETKENELALKAHYCGFHVHLIALLSQANTHGVLLVSGLQEEQVYFIFFRCVSTTEAAVLSSRSMNIVSS